MTEFKKVTLNREDHADIEREAAIIRKVVLVVWGLVTILGWVMYFLK